MKKKFMCGIAMLAMIVGTISCNKNNPVREASAFKDGMKEAYIYAFPLLMNYGVMYEFAIDKNSGQYKAPFNQISNEARVFTPKDTTVITPNSDTPYSLVTLNLRAEPVVLCVPKVEKSRYYVIQLVDMYTFNYGYMGSRTTGNDAGCFMVSGPDWKGDAPAGIKQVFRSETQFSMAVYRTQLFNAADMPNVVKIQAGYKVQPLSQFLHQTAPPASPEVKWPVFNKDKTMKTDFPAFLNFILQFCPPVEAEKPIRAKLAVLGMEANKPFEFEKLSEAQKAEMMLALKEGYDAIEKQRTEIGKDINGWLVGSALGSREFYHGDWVLRAAGALAGIYGNSEDEATYPMAKADNKGEKLDGSKHNYTITFAADAFPPVNAFWSVTMYDGKTQLLIENPINRYLINSPMIPNLKKNKHGSLTMYVQYKSPGKEKESNWLPAPNGPIYTVMRLYWPKERPPSILPLGSGTWQPPAIMQAD